MTSTRPRSLSGRSCRKIDVQTCVSVSQFQNLVPGPSFGATVFVSAIFRVQGSRFKVRASDFRLQTSDDSSFQERLGVRPLTQLALEMTALVDEDLSVFGQHDARPFEGPRCRALEVDAGNAEATAVARPCE